MRTRRWFLVPLLVAIGADVAIDRYGASWMPVGTEVQLLPPNLDFSMMAIATRPVDASELSGTSRALAKVRVRAWERCELGYASCDEPRPRTVEAACLSSRRIVLINEKDWSAFQRIPDEDLQGLENAPKDMNLLHRFCSIS